jgi:hypothetical protein
LQINLGWEVSFEQIIDKLREFELIIIKKCTFYQGLLNFNFNFLTYVITIASLITFIYSDEKNVLDPSIAYVSFMLFNNIRFPLFLIGIAVSYFVHVKFILFETFFYKNNIGGRKYCIFLILYRFSNAKTTKNFFKWFNLYIFRTSTSRSTK